ncbi:insulinase family protein [Archangium violaceum]|uniref:M16 family metallopeptidase n=1 Tax=Archangium violaceum TaxID=83451 RepID=UPI00194F856E|nr:pitrilysin family protein [Archangium violaceum]QRO00025.1 insulinase family protein [Archangium violaceum]
MRSLISRSLALSAALCLGGCATTSQTAPPPEAPAPQAPQQEQAQAPAQPQAPATVPTVPLHRPAPMQLVVQANPASPIVSFRLVFHAGSVDDPKGKEGLTALTADVLSEGGTRNLTSAQLLEALFPMAAELNASTDKELTVFSGRVHKDHLARFLDIFTDVLLAPRLSPQEFERLRARALSDVRNGLRSENDEMLGKVALDALLYQGHPYAHFVGGTEKGLESITLEDVKAHAARVFTQDRLVIGLAGPVDEALQKTVVSRLSALPATGAPRVELPPVPTTAGRALVVQKPTLSTAVSLGYVTPLRRGDPDFFPVSFALSYLGEHRQSSGVLFGELREKRGLNYGDYAYAEHFIEQPGTTYNRTNIARTQQDITVWIRPVVPGNGMFATRGALYFLDRLVKQGIPQDQFELRRGFLLGYSRLWEQTDQRRLGYAIDSLLYGTPDFLEQYRAALAKMTPESVQAAVRRQIRPEALNFAFVTQDADGLAKLLKEQPPSPISYASPKPPELLSEDKAIISLPLPIRADAVQVVPAQTFMEK